MSDNKIDKNKNYKNKNYFYRLMRGATILCGGALRCQSMDEAFKETIKVKNIKLRKKYYDKSSMYAGLISGYDFMLNGKRVEIFISISARHYETQKH